MIDISVVVPVYGCPEALESLHERVVKTIKSLKKKYELILVNDGCPKGSWEIIKKICDKDKNVVGVNLSRNFGQLHSTNAGISLAKGDFVVLMDCDLQDKPEGIADLYIEIKKGYEIVFAKRKNRKDSKFAILASKLFYKIYNSFVEGHYDGDICNFCIVRKRIIDKYNEIKDNNKSFTTTLSWMGYKAAYVEIDSDLRYEGKSSYTLSKKIQLAIDMLTSQSNKPLIAVVYFGMILALLAFLYLIIQVIKFLIFRDAPTGWTSMIASVFLMGGLTLVSIGGVGIYVGNIFNQTKGVPEYLIDEILNRKEQTKE